MQCTVSNASINAVSEIATQAMKLFDRMNDYFFFTCGYIYLFFIHLPFYLSLHLPTYASIYLYIHIFISTDVHQSIYLYLSPYYLFIYPLIYLYRCSSIHLSLYLFIPLLSNISIYLSLQMPITPYISLAIHPLIIYSHHIFISIDVHESTYLSIFLSLYFFLTFFHLQNCRWTAGT